MGLRQALMVQMVGATHVLQWSRQSLLSWKQLRNSPNLDLSSDCRLKLVDMKSDSVVITE